ncbi:uncharacterized protein LOC110024353 [Phalaenopsis equestris]|uniref:uncharacterized protein LOC110024353 n=1 Tax=Phalaenopsis equestris TaxID=78828 RepID=UPI0009E2C516|nr:uncharacterized protein LOC110024353 [Phalaenopsis equestris]XP_020579925.1 uncharacterized protein LOC110024353 [Phalaenopsis equestris]
MAAAPPEPAPAKMVMRQCSFIENGPGLSEKDQFVKEAKVGSSEPDRALARLTRLKSKKAKPSDYVFHSFPILDSRRCPLFFRLGAISKIEWCSDCISFRDGDFTLRVE